jgi:hypothetical protein
MGVTGLSPLAELPLFDIINGFAVDSMHAVFHGVFKDVLQRIIKSISAHKLADFNSRLLNVHIPQEVSRPLRPIAEFTRGNWRVSELRTVTYLAPILFRGLLPVPQYENIVLFSTAIYYLHSAAVSAVDLPKCHRQLQRFCRQLHSIYKDKSVYTYNVHLLLHLTSKVQQAGPLYTHSCDEFEMLFAKMLLVQHGSRAAPEQIFRYFSVRSLVDRTSLPDAITNAPLSLLCKRIMSKYYSTQLKSVSPNTSLLGPGTTVRLHKSSFATVLPSEDEFVTLECYTKCAIDGHIYKVFDICSNTIRVDCYLYIREKFYLLQYIALIDDCVFFLCKRITTLCIRSVIPTSKLELRYPLHKICAVTPALRCFKLRHAFTKCYVLKLYTEQYLLPLPTAQHRS